MGQKLLPGSTLPGSTCILLSPGPKGPSWTGPPTSPTLGREMFSKAPVVPGQRDTLWQQQVTDPPGGHYLRVRGEGPQGLKAAGGKAGRERQHMVKGSNDRLGSHSSSFSPHYSPIAAAS